VFGCSVFIATKQSRIFVNFISQPFRQRFVTCGPGTVSGVLVNSSFGTFHALVVWLFYWMKANGWVLCICALSLSLLSGCFYHIIQENKHAREAHCRRTCVQVCRMAVTAISCFRSARECLWRMALKTTTYVYRLKVKGLDIYRPSYRHLHEHDHQRFTIRSGVLTGNDARWRSASSSSPLPQWTDFGSRSLSSRKEGRVFREGARWRGQRAPPPLHTS